MARKGITVYLPPDLEAQVQRLAKAEHRSDSSVITEAVRLHFTPKLDAEAAETPLRDTRRLDARFDKVIGEQLIVKETLLLFIRVWLEHNPPLDESVEDAAAASAEARFERFLDMVAGGLQPGQSIANGELHAAALSARGDESETHP